MRLVLALCYIGWKVYWNVLALCAFARSFVSFRWVGFCGLLHELELQSRVEQFLFQHTPHESHTRESSHDVARDAAARSASLRPQPTAAPTMVRYVNCGHQRRDTVRNTFSSSSADWSTANWLSWTGGVEAPAAQSFRIDGWLTTESAGVR